MKAIVRFFSIQPSKRLIILRLLWYIVWAEAILRFLPYSKVQKLIFSPKCMRQLTPADSSDTLYCHLKLLDVMCRRLPWTPTCLRRAMALHYSLAAYGVESSIKIGVCREEKGFLAHAWLECCGMEVLKNRSYSQLN